MSERDRKSARFPAPSYARQILEPAFLMARMELFGPMMAANKAHAVMLTEQRIIDLDNGSRLVRAILQAEAQTVSAFQYDPTVEDLFFAVERRIIDIAGDGAGGNLQLGRSRNDLSAALCRLVLRQRLLDLASIHAALRERLALLAEEHVDTLMPGVTHTQEAQPTTLAHYLLGVLGPMERDAERLRLTYEHANRSPLGVAAFTTSSLPVNRGRVATLLGFDGLVENGYDAVGAADHMLETVGTLRICCLNLIRFVNDLLIWCRSDVAIVRVGSEFLQISSIMPQKRNPVVLEHIRARIGYVVGDANTVETMVHGASFGDTVDVEDEIFVPLFRCCDDTASVLTLLADVLKTIQFDTRLLGIAAHAGFGASTELAERLAVDFGLPFRQAHRVVAQIVRELAENGGDLRALTPRMLTQAVHNVTHGGVDITDRSLLDVVDPKLVVARRVTPGGPAPKAVIDALRRERESRLAFETWTAERWGALAMADRELNDAARLVASGASD